jgi:hypothetical protein
MKFRLIQAPATSDNIVSESLTVVSFGNIYES